MTEQTDGTKQLLLNESPVWGSQELGTSLAGTENRSEGLVRKYLPFERGPQTVVLLEGLQECRFEYFRIPGPNQPGTWTDEWIVRTEEVPQAIRINVASPTGSGELKPTTSVTAVRHFSRRRESQLSPLLRFFRR